MFYYDTGVLLKLYTEESESVAVRRFVVRKASPIPFHAFHRAECASALQLKAFRGECDTLQANQALADIEDDLHHGVLQPMKPDWDEVWALCAEFANRYASETGCRTLDTLHVACARVVALRDLVTTDLRQARLAEKVGMRVHSPLPKPS